MLREEKGWCTGSLRTYTHSHTTQRRPHRTYTLTGSHKRVPDRVAGPPKGPMLSFPTLALQVASSPQLYSWGPAIPLRSSRYKLKSSCSSRMV